ncbi:hypothetical protein HRS9122_00608 [Pyrenophora teres f. teres]|nr:hypothetical protein HRS9122_00608 [Pyrenophora teres f. teres]
MAALAFKAISYGAEQIPDKFFEKIPGGFFTPAEQKEIDKHRKNNKNKGNSRKERRQSEEPSARRSSRRERSPPTEYSDYYTDDSEYEREREQKKRERRRAKSVAKASSRSLSRGRHSQHDSDLDGQYSDTRDMAQPGHGQPYFPPPPASEYRPYNPQEYAPSPVQDHRSSATPAYGYPPKPAAPQPYGGTQDYGQHETSRAAARYTPDAGYAPSPVADAPIPPPPVGSNSPMNPYHHTDFPANGAGYQPSPPPFNRQRSNSQPPFAPMPNPAYPTYPAASREQVVPYAESSPGVTVPGIVVTIVTEPGLSTPTRTTPVLAKTTVETMIHAWLKRVVDSTAWICERRVWLRRWEEQQRVHSVLDRWRPDLGEKPDTQVLLSSLLMPNIEAEAIAAPRPVPAPVRALAHMIASAAKVPVFALEAAVSLTGSAQSLADPRIEMQEEMTAGMIGAIVVPTVDMTMVVTNMTISAALPRAPVRLSKRGGTGRGTTEAMRGEMGNCSRLHNLHMFVKREMTSTTEACFVSSSGN